MKRRQDLPTDGTSYLPSRYEGLFDVTELVGQFRVSSDSLEVPNGWREHRIGPWQLVHDRAIPARRIIMEDRVIGWLVGYPVSPEGTMVIGDLDWSFENGDAGHEEEVEQILYSHGGRFVAFLFAPHRPRVYVDPMGSLGVLFSADQRIVASSPFLIPRTSPPDDRTELVQALGVPGSEAIYPFGLTPRASIDYVMPNHYLDLTDWTVKRHWPTGDIEYVEDPATMVREIMRGIRKNIGAVVRSGPAQMSLTAGQDSRALLACSREYLDDITFITFSLSDTIGRPDRNVAPRIARSLGLSHRLIRASKHTRLDDARWVYRTGCIVDEPRGRRLIRAMDRLDPNKPYLLGTSGEVARGLYWRSDDTPSTPLTAESVLKRKKIVPHPEILARARRWLEELPVHDTRTKLDLLQIERGLGGWNGFLMYGFPHAGRYHLFPYNDRGIFGAMLRLPPEYRRNQLLVHDIIAATWPELRRFPFNEGTFGVYGAYQRFRRFAKKVLR
ncbi:MAG: hypothetical protein GWP04_10580 [Gammaproteobacteria bacterium]|nr:hypothetical protein [Gammaproteobacteria bacterium]